MGAAAENTFPMDVAAWFSNVSTSVLIVFVNKLLMKSTGYGFHFATTLTALHFLVCSIAVWIVQSTGAFKPTSMPRRGGAGSGRRCGHMHVSAALSDSLPCCRSCHIYCGG